MRRLIAIMLSVLLAGPAQSAELSQADYTIKLRGFTVGSFHLSTRESGTRYVASALIKDAGLLSVFRSFFYRAASQGVLRGGQPVPGRYEEVADTGRRQSEVVLDYSRGMPVVTKYVSTTPVAADAPDPATQGGTLDPMTALFAVFRDVPGDKACGTKIVMYDGMRRSHLVLSEPRRDGGVLHCRGEYRRLQGFTPKELERNVAFPLDFTFADAGGGMVHVARVEITSSYGLATLDRR